MKLYDFITKLNYEAALLPNMGRICGGDIYELNHYQNVKYPAFCATQLQHSEAGDWRYYQFNLFYVDRLTSTHGNAQQIQSEAIDALSTIIRNITSYGIELQGSVLYDTFTERFDSECAGAYATVTFAAMADDICPQWYRDPVRKIYYTLVVLDPADERFLRDSDILIDGDARFLFNQFDQKTGSGIIWVILEKPDGYMNFNIAREQITIRTIDFSDIDIEFRFGENGLGINYSRTLEEIIFPEKLTYLGLLQSAVFSSVTLPDTVTYISHTFLYCYDLVNVVYGGTMEQWNAIPKFSNRPEYPYDSLNWHGGETAPMFCEVICSDGVVALCKPDCECNPCPVDSPCNSDCSSDCSSDAPCGDCALDGVCTSDGSDCPTDGSDCPTDGSDCPTDGSDCPTDGVCTEDAPCVDCAEDICSMDFEPYNNPCNISFPCEKTGSFNRGQKITSVSQINANTEYMLYSENGYALGKDAASNGWNNCAMGYIGAANTFNGPEIYSLFDLSPCSGLCEVDLQFTPCSAITSANTFSLSADLLITQGTSGIRKIVWEDRTDFIYGGSWSLDQGDIAWLSMEENGRLYYNENGEKRYVVEQDGGLKAFSAEQLDSLTYNYAYLYEVQRVAPEITDLGTVFNGEYMLEECTPQTELGSNDVFVIANNGIHATIADINGSGETFGYRAVQSNGGYTEGRGITGKWATFKVYRENGKYILLENIETDLALSVKDLGCYVTVRTLENYNTGNTHSFYVQEINNGRALLSIKEFDYIIPEARYLYNGFGFSQYYTGNYMTLYKLIPVE